MNLFRNFKSVTKTAYGRGSFGKLGEILEPHRSANKGFMVFLVDHYFQGNEAFLSRIPKQEADEVIFCSTAKEPSTEQIDGLRDDILARRGLPAGLVGIGGGNVMDVAKALSLMFTNEGSSVQYQGLNLIKKPGIYHCGVPTISGTGAEVSMTAVLTGPVKKLGLKCDWTVFDQIVLDPDLIATVPTDQWFYTGMDTYIHSVEAITGTKKNTFAEAYSEKSLELCREVYLKRDRSDPKSDELLMVASYMGGLSLTYSEVGVCHALSYGLGKVLEMHHCFANCVAFNQLDDVYGEYVHEFKHMVKERGIHIPANLAKDWDEATLDAMAEVAYNLPHMWDHAFGPDWQQVLDRERIKGVVQEDVSVLKVMETPAVIRHGPDRRHVIEYQLLGEIRYGPAYYLLRLDRRIVADLVVGDEGLWLNDSLYAAQEWLTTEERLGPNTRLLLIDASNSVVSKFKVVEGGFVDSFELIDRVIRYRKRWHSSHGESVTEAEVKVEEIRNWTPIQFSE